MSSYFFSLESPFPQTVDSVYITLLNRVMNGSTSELVKTRNSVCKRIFISTIVFKQTPLVTVRKTAWKNALREMEWFLSGSNNINNLHPDVRHWWEPFTKIDDKTLCHNYSKAFRRIYDPNNGKPVPSIEPKTMKEDDPLMIPQFPRHKPSGDGKYVGYKGKNHHGDTFIVIEKCDNSSKYLIQFDSNGYTVESNPGNFIRGTVKNPYYPTFLGMGCYGEVDKDKYSYYDKAYQTWSDMMNRCYNVNRRHYRWYENVYVCGRWKMFSNFLEDIGDLPGFEEWLNSTNMHLDKDYNKANYYGPDVCIFLPQKYNLEIRNNAQMNRRSIEIDQISELLDGLRQHPNSRRNLISTWIPTHVQSELINPTNCHGTIIQTFVDTKDRIHLYMYQRSCDLLLGVPHNWIQYWAFLLYLSRHTGKGVGSFIWNGGDIHIYEEHFQTVEKLLNLNPVEYSGRCVDMSYSDTAIEIGVPLFKADHFNIDNIPPALVDDKVKMIV